MKHKENKNHSKKTPIFKDYLCNFLKKRFVLHALILAFFMIIPGLTAIKLGQDVNFDLHNYHYNNPHALFSGETEKNVAVSGIQSYDNPLRDIPAYLLMSHLSPKKAGFALGMIQGINLWLVFEILFAALGYLKIHRYKRLCLSLLVALFTLYGSGFNSELGTTMGDNTTSIFVLLSILLLLYSIGSKSTYLGVNGLRFLSFVSIGISAGLKLTNISYLLGIFVAGYFLKSQSKVRIKKLLTDILAIGIGVFLAGGLWFIKIWMLFGNPIFPFYNGIFKSQYYPPENFIDTRWNNASLWDSLFEPFSYTKHQAISSEVYFRDPRLAIMFILLAAIFIYFIYIKFLSKRSIKSIAGLNKEFKTLLLFLLVSYVAWCVQFSYYRYLISIELLSLIVISLSIFILIKRFWISALVIVALCAGITLNTIQTSWGRVTWQTTNFGVTKNDFSYLDNSTVVLAGYQPYSFLIPYFPDSTEVLRITSDLSSPTKGTESMQGLIMDRINNSKASGRQFYVVVVDEDRPYANAAAKELKSSISNCNEIPVIVRTISNNKYRICELKMS